MERPRRLPSPLRWAAWALLTLSVAGCEYLPWGDPSPTPSPTLIPTPEPIALDVRSRPVRVRVPSLAIDLPIISFDRRVRGSTRGYPACDVASYWTVFDQPGAPGTTWILAHAQEGMFLPLLEVANARGGRSLVGRHIELQLRDGRLLTYRIFRVRERAATTDVRIATANRRKREQRLILQTSTGVGSDPKLQVAARLVRAERTDEPRPRPKPRACG